MKRMNILMLLLLFPFYALLATNGSQLGAGYGKEWVVTEKSQLTISGSSNVNEFQCMSLSYAGGNSLYETWDVISKRPVMSGLITLKASAFDCQNKIMTQDMQKTIKADKYPNVKVHFLSLERMPSSGHQQKAKGVVEICLAGVSRQYEISATFQELGKSKAMLAGSLEFNLTDFNIEPPTKMMGAIKVKDCFTIDFNLELKSYDTTLQ
ncbi:YceI family protein [Cesiribacter sp. SM1]|uniref:YceI family protein n=1 Tax=Cesiribacter sp. SM1 TaxID=2861196 RepID=UPI001CD52A91|nr:YceI family protein [Cesiribacter sp. SM1]